MVAAGDLFTVDCETLPGAYLRRHLPGQFSTHDYPPRREVVATLEQRGLACKYLAAEMPCEIARTAPATETAMDEKRWIDQHAQVRARLQDWEMALHRLSMNGSQPVEQQAAEASLHEILKYLETVLTAHCRQEESELFPVFHRNADITSKLAAFREDHERFGVDLDKFERQMVSYGLSGDPTVLLTLGARMIREMRAHLEAEEQLSSDLFHGSLASSARAAGQTAS
jgi:hypothetical protein